MDEDYDANVLDNNPYVSSTGIVGSMVNSASQFGDVASSVYSAANAYAKSQGGWGNTIENAAQGYVNNHGGVAGTSAHLGHEALNVAANTLWGAKDWGNAYRAAKSGHWGDALGSAAWGLAAIGGTAALALPGAGEAIKGGEMAAQAARAGAREGIELAAKEGGEAAAKGAVEGGSTAAEKIGKGERWAHRAKTVAGINMPDPQIGAGQQQTYTRAY
jgi:hypothetical protein